MNYIKAAGPQLGYFYKVLKVNKSEENISVNCWVHKPYTNIAVSWKYATTNFYVFFFSHMLLLFGFNQKEKGFKSFKYVA